MFERYAIFFTPTGALAGFGAQWLGWDSAQGCAVSHPDIPGIDLAQLTQTPRKYGVHGTLKAPFHLRAGCDLAQLRSVAADFAAAQPSVEIGAIEPRYANGFVALRPRDQSAQLQSFAAATVKVFDSLRAPLSEADIARRRRAKLSPRQDQQMLDWGYPFIFEDFHFHMTLSGRLPPESAAQVIDALTPRLDGIVADPFVIDAVTLMGQDADGMFHQIHRYTLTG